MNTSEKIWQAYHQKLAAFISSKVAADAVEDLLQDIFLKIHRHISSLREDVKLENWVFQITRNAISDYYRTKKMVEELPDWIKQPEPDEAEIIKKELSSCLVPMVNGLPEKYRDAIQMSELENKTQKEVAEQAGISLSGAKSRVQRGRALLRTMLEDCCQFEINLKNQVVSYEKKTSHCKAC